MYTVSRTISATTLEVSGKSIDLNADRNGFALAVATRVYDNAMRHAIPVEEMGFSLYPVGATPKVHFGAHITAPILGMKAVFTKEERSHEVHQ